jgi:hypothetical protein
MKLLIIKVNVCNMWKETVDVELPNILNAQIKKEPLHAFLLRDSCLNEHTFISLL